MSGSVLRGVGMQSFDDWDGEEEEFFFLMIGMEKTKSPAWSLIHRRCFPE